MDQTRSCFEAESMTPSFSHWTRNKSTNRVFIYGKKRAIIGEQVSIFSSMGQNPQG